MILVLIIERISIASLLNNAHASYSSANIKGSFNFRGCNWLNLLTSDTILLEEQRFSQ